MKMLRGIVVPGYDPKNYCLELIKNIYGQKQAGKIWNRYLCEGFAKLGFEQSAIDECVRYKGSTIFMYFVNDGILCGPNKSEIEAII